MKRTKVRRNLKSSLYSLCFIALILIAILFKSELGIRINDKYDPFMFILVGGAFLVYLMFPHSVFDKDSITLYRTEESKLKRFIRSDFEKIEFSVKPMVNGFLVEEGKLIIDISTVRFSDIALIETEFGATALIHADEVVNDAEKENNGHSDLWAYWYLLLVMVPLVFIVFGFTQLMTPIIMRVFN